MIIIIYGVYYSRGTSTVEDRSTQQNNWNFVIFSLVELAETDVSRIGFRNDETSVAYPSVQKFYMTRKCRGNIGFG
jgi:hypothetical protein